MRRFRSRPAAPAGSAAARGGDPGVLARARGVSAGDVIFRPLPLTGALVGGVCGGRDAAERGWE